jgi:hypothetical protein
MEIVKDDLIYGQRFEELADVTVGEDGIPTFGTELKEEKPVLIYSHTHDARKMFEVIRNLNKRRPLLKFIAITGNSDGKVRAEKDCNRPEDAPVEQLPDSVIMWYAQNVCVPKHPRLHSIPIGLENPHWFTSLAKMDKMLEVMKEDIPRNKHVYMNHNISTNKDERQSAYRAFSGVKGVTVDMHQNPHNYYSYLRHLKSHEYIVCPEGNGTDTHRMWEALYLGCKPILRRSENTKFYEGYVCAVFIDEWSDFHKLGRYQLWPNGSGRRMLFWQYWKDRLTKGV